jgi:hypothetical protein
MGFTFRLDVRISFFGSYVLWGFWLCCREGMGFAAVVICGALLAISERRIA